MSKSKDKRIRKFKKKRIWPSILGLFIVSICFMVIMLAVVAFLVSDVVKNKIVAGIHDTEEVSHFFEKIESFEELAEIEETLLFYIDIETDVESIAVIEDDKVVWSSDDRYPSRTSESEFMITDDIRVFIEDDPENNFIIEDNTLNVSKDFINSIEIKEILGTEEMIIPNGTALAHLKVWFEVPTEVGNVYVLKDLKVYQEDLFTLIICTVLIAVIIATFMIYYLISFIGLFFDMHKNSKIIYTDMLTGGENRLFFEKKGNSLIRKAGRRGKKYAVIHLKMRKYRSYCTCFGVKEGEALIEKCYALLKKQISRKELMVHRENAQFGLLLAYENREQLVTRVEKIESVLNTISPNIKLYFGVGIYLTQIGDKDIEQLYNNALLACDMLGEEAENKIAFFDVEMNNQRIWERKVEDDMNRALKNKEFQVYLQPKIKTSEEVLAGAEALVRWIHPQEGFIPPNKFIPIFEKNGFITKLDDYMLEEVASLQEQWIKQGNKIVPISVNVSRAHFTRSDLAAHICSIVDKYEVPHNVIELELTESAFFDDKKQLLDTINQLRELGFSVSMDDFGAGYSSLNSLKEMHIDVLKIDADFFRGADVEERGMLIVSEVIELAKKLDMKIVAEGIESREQVDFLTEQECDLIQGYFFSKPMPVAEFVEKYKDFR